ncbi:hypothetical protein EUGRSUZ_G02510 [Eucalyptus grandis]|uniref:Uncharacterized protein n=2 Tax=Eucalyptus grandis TaxID=71139 RepID=A0ACC3K7K3_EUCGR|nr:hypothetical protein EUGRSUZ_G02510 [Eucalyptus grandis]
MCSRIGLVGLLCFNFTAVAARAFQRGGMSSTMTHPPPRSVWRVRPHRARLQGDRSRAFQSIPQPPHKCCGPSSYFHLFHIVCPLKFRSFPPPLRFGARENEAEFHHCVSFGVLICAEFTRSHDQKRDPRLCIFCF